MSYRKEDLTSPCNKLAGHLTDINKDTYRPVKRVTITVMSFIKDEGKFFDEM